MATGEAATGDELARSWAVQLVTHRPDGTTVPTAVNLATDGRRLFFRTYDRSGKARRLARNPAVAVRAADWRGRPSGPEITAVAELLSGDDADHAARLIDAKHPWFQRRLVRLGHRLMRYRTLHYELLLAPRTR
ncbi:hypothetical protein BH23CHL7_BH23CHL7_07520 [soil metagenome]